MGTRHVGIDVGAETVKIVELVAEAGSLRVERRDLVEHHEDPGSAVRELLARPDWSDVSHAAATGRGSRLLGFERVPTKAALARGVRFAFPEHDPGTVVSIGSHGFSVLELRHSDHQTWRENSRCSQGTGNFLRQLVGRFDLDVEEASAICASVEQPAALSGRCPVILKTDMTHLANKGEDRAPILAGLYDAVCENVQVLIKPGVSPPDVLLAGGVARSSRVRDHFRRFLEERGMRLVVAEPEECLYLEALGAAAIALERRLCPPPWEGVVVQRPHAGFEVVPALRDAMDRVRRMPPEVPASNGATHRVLLGFDVGSTGSKAVALDTERRRPVWEGYVDTLGDPVGAARRLAAAFLEETGGRHTVHAVGATGSGREIVGSLMSSCFGPEPLYVLNEIAAHARGALYYDPEVDTIFEIGGQDAKYIRLDGGQVCDAAMNEACSAGTGSFIAEQGSKFQDMGDVVRMGERAMEADSGISLGQHCSVFMAEVIDEAVAAGCEAPAIVAGLYDSVVQNYLNRVKGSRSVGRRIFCQGMPFLSDALAAAVGRQTGRTVTVPPNPGTIGALGIALLAAEAIPVTRSEPLDLTRFLTATVDRRDTFVCKSKRGCGEPGNRCRIDRIRTTVADRRQRFLWGGSCSLFDSGTRSRKLPDRAPDPFRARRRLVADVIERVSAPRGRPTVAMTEEFALKGLLPFVSTFVHELGFDVQVQTGAGRASLKRGIESAEVPFCAPMQLYHGITSELADRGTDLLLAPRVRDLPRSKGEPDAVTCPVVQGSPDILRTAHTAGRPRLVTTRIDIGPENLASSRFLSSTRDLARDLGAAGRWAVAYEAGCRAQERFDAALRAIGTEALAFAKAHDLVTVMVLGRAYTIHNDVLNSNVPTLLREQGAMAVPVDCYPVADSVPVFDDLYWGYSQTNLRAAHQIRRTAGQYAVFCSNYACGPDSFNLHFFAYVMANKPFAIIETDGHAGDAGTKTRIEAFLHCVEGDRQRDPRACDARPITDFDAVVRDKTHFLDVKRRKELLLVPRMGENAELFAALCHTEGVRAEVLPRPTRDSLRIGRRHTSGKECVPMTITVGSLLERIEQDRDTDERFAFFMPTANGPCRFGVYNLLHKIVLEQVGWEDRVRLLSPSDVDYFAGMAPDFRIRLIVLVVAGDLLGAALNDVRPVETRPGAARQVYDRYYGELRSLAGRLGPGTLRGALGELPNGMFGVRDLLRRAAAAFREVKDFSKDLPTVLVTGEIYVRFDPFANGFVIDQLEERGVRALVSPFNEYLEYTAYQEIQRLREDRAVEGDAMLGARFVYTLETSVIERLYKVMARALDWGERPTVEASLKAAAPYLDRQLVGEAVMTIGGAVYEHEHGAVDGVVSVGPHECMPNKVAEAQLAVAGRERGLLSLTLPLTGDPIDPEVLDRFVFEVQQRYESRRAAARGSAPPRPFASGVGPLLLRAQGRALMGALRALTPFTRRPRRDPGATAHADQ